MRSRIRKKLTLLFSIALLSLVGAACSDSTVNDTDTHNLVVVSYGGTYQDAQRVAMFGPFVTTGDVSLEERVYDGGYETFRDSIAGGQWDVVDVEGNMVLLGSNEGLLAPIDYDVVPTTGLLPNAVNEHGVGVMAFSYVLAYDSDVISPTEVADPWKTLFDPDAVPGPRGLHDEPRRTLEIALMADGVSPENLYPLDVDRAFSVLSAFRDKMNNKGTPIVWWNTYDQPQTLLENNQVVMTPGVNGRLIAARRGGAPIDLVWKNGILDFDWWVVPNESTHKDEAMTFLAYAVSAKAQAALAQAIPYSPINDDAWALIPDNLESDLPTSPENVDTQIWFDTQWWVDNLESVQARWDAWRAE